MEKQNITLSVPREVIRAVKVIAARDDTSISALITRMLTEMVDEDQGYRTAGERSRRRMRDGFDLNTGGQRGWTRDELHAR